MVEAEYRSGSSITANYAKEQGKTVYAIPSNIDVSTGIGTNYLIRRGASLVTKPSQIQKELFHIEKPVFIEESSNKNKNNRVFVKENDYKNEFNSPIQIPKEYQEIDTLLKNGPMHINEIVKKQPLSISELNGKLTIMEIEGYIERLDSNVYKRKE